ncbi:DNA replication/repair protein RecF [Methylogaea oryzae]|uniref:DNA replication/repair protein RecF n=1 Tax=Methylogaea oryzae TaxID=1295382 RepID=UPI0006CF8A48|nr:DNA replication and repair protein RecF [Methylogaea oryzae]
MAGQLRSSASPGFTQIDISVVGAERRRRVDGRVCEKQAELAALLPVVLLQPSSQILLESSPELRRQYMDWGAFQTWGATFLSCWRRYGKCLEQRNSLLRGGGSAGLLATWEKELERYGEALARLRGEYVELLGPWFADAVSRLAADLGGVDFSYDAGWPPGVALSEILGRSRDKDRRLGYTSVGPHRGDFRISVDGHPVKQVLSRGQLKLVVAALKVSQARMARFRGDGGEVCLLVDDLSAELDTINRRRLLGYLQESDLQALVTGTGWDQFEGIGFGADAAMFHVEHGVVASAKHGINP